MELLAVELSSNETQVFEAYSVVGNQLRPLPIGSALDREKGIFCWLPGPGFMGQYHFIFLMKSDDGSLYKRNVIIRIEPKFGILHQTDVTRRPKVALRCLM
jgi:hypothetical protein